MKGFRSSFLQTLCGLALLSLAFGTMGCEYSTTPTPTEPDAVKTIEEQIKTLQQQAASPVPSVTAEELKQLVKTIEEQIKTLQQQAANPAKAAKPATSEELKQLTDKITALQKQLEGATPTTAGGGPSGGGSSTITLTPTTPTGGVGETTTGGTSGGTTTGGTGTTETGTGTTGTGTGTSTGTGTGTTGTGTGTTGTGTGTGTGTTGGTDTTAPKVDHTVPANNTTIPPTVNPIEVTFNKAMNADTVRSGFSIRMPDPDHWLSWVYIPGTVAPFSTENRVFRFTPNAPLPPSSTFTGMLFDSIRDMTGTPLTGTSPLVVGGQVPNVFTWQFTTSASGTTADTPIVVTGTPGTTLGTPSGTLIGGATGGSAGGLPLTDMSGGPTTSTEIPGGIRPGSISVATTGGATTSYAGNWTYVELLNSKAPTDPQGRCPCGTIGNPDLHHNDPTRCGPTRYTSPAIVDSSGNVTIFGNSTWGTINSSGIWSGSPTAAGYTNGTVRGTCTLTSTPPSCSGTFTADIITNGVTAPCWRNGTFTMTKN